MDAQSESTSSQFRQFFSLAFGRYTFGGMVALAITGSVLGGIVHGLVGMLVGALVGGASAAIFAIQIALIWLKRKKTMPWHVLAVATAVLTLMVMRDVSGLLLFMREEGMSARSIGWITRTSNTQEVMDNAVQLAYFDAAIEGVRTSRWIIWAAIALDSIVFVWAYGMAGTRILVSRQQRVQGKHIPNVDRFRRWAIGLLVVVLVIDWIENLALGVLIEDSLATVAADARSAASAGASAPSGVHAAGLTSVFVGLTTALWGAKWFCIGLVLLLVLADHFSCKGHDNLRGQQFVWFTKNSAELIEAGRRVRPLLVTLVVLAGLLFQPLQVDDLMLSLGDDGWKLTYAFVVTIWMGATLWSWTRRLLRNQRPRKLRDPSDWSYIGIGLVLIMSSFVLVMWFDWRNISIFPGLAMVLVGAGGFLVKNGEDTGAPVVLPGDGQPVEETPREVAWDETLGVFASIWGYVRREQYGLVLIGGIGLVMFGLGIILARVEDWSPVVVIPGAIVIAIAARGTKRRAKMLKDRSGVHQLRFRHHATDKQDPTDFLPAFVGAGAVMIVGTSMLASAAAEAAFASGSSGALRVTLAGGALVVFSGAVLGFKRWQVFGNEDPQNESLVSSRAMAEVTLGVSLVAVLVLAVWVWIEPVGASRHVGALALLLLLITAIGAVSGQLIGWIDHVRAPRIFRQFSIQRVPVFALIGLWLIVGQLTLDRSNHDVPEPLPLTEVAAHPSGCAGPTPSHPSMNQAWLSWLETNAIREGNAGARTQYPLIVLASSGGGIRAGWWSAAVMGELIPEPGPACPDVRPDKYEGRQIFVASGVSGGSLGLATHQAAVVVDVIREEDGDVTPEWVRERLGIDHLSPPLAWFAYVELAQSMFGFPVKSDRAAIMEQSWEEAWGDQAQGMQRGLHQTWESHPQLPILALNGTSVHDGCRVIVTVLDLNSDVDSCDESDLARIEGEGSRREGLPQTYGLGSLMCSNHDMRLSTAALLSARFPLITPSGRLGTGWTVEDGECSPRGAIEVVDGGYRDANGAETAIDVWREVQPLVTAYNNDSDNPVCVVPVFVQILDDFRLPAPPAEASYWAPLLGPIKAILSASGTLSHTGDRAIAAEAAFAEHRYEIQPKEVPPGAHPALGWSLSATTQDKMWDALEDEGAQSSGIAEFRSAMDDLTGSACS